MAWQISEILCTESQKFTNQIENRDKKAALKSGTVELGLLQKVQVREQ